MHAHQPSDRKPTPHEVRAEVWMSLIHGSRGLIYFVHQFKPKFIEAALLADPEMLTAVTAINRQIKELAPVLNSPTVPEAVKVNSTNEAVPIATMVKRHAGTTYLFAVAMRNAETQATLRSRGSKGRQLWQCLVRADDHRKGRKVWRSLRPWDVHLYRLPAESNDELVSRPQQL